MPPPSSPSAAQVRRSEDWSLGISSTASICSGFSTSSHWSPVRESSAGSNAWDEEIASRGGGRVGAYVPGTGPPQAYGPGLFLVRPDGCVGWAGEAPAGLAAYAEPLGLGLTSA